MRYAIVIEAVPGGVSAYVPDLPGCIATGTTLMLLRKEIRTAITLHLTGLRSDGAQVPEPATLIEYIESEPEIGMP